MSIGQRAALLTLTVLLISVPLASPSSGEPADPGVGAAPALEAPAQGTDAGCPHAGNGPCCTSCREKREQAAAADKPLGAEEPAGCPCRRARKLAGGS
jgi:hypothetical protein